MMLSVFKLAIIAVILWLYFTELLVHQARTIRIQWQIGLDFWAIGGTIGACLSAVLCLILLANIWKFGSKDTAACRVYALQHKILLLYSGSSCLLLVVLSEMEFLWRTSTWRSSAGVLIGVGAFLSVVVGCRRLWPKKDRKTVYGLQHGRLHLDAQVPMWMNMGYWKVDEKNTSRPKTMAEACRDLLKLVLAEAGFSGISNDKLPRCLIDVGFGCGEQTIHLTSDKPVRRCDELWWDTQDHQAYFDHYIGITQDRSQWEYARERVDELKQRLSSSSTKQIALFCCDAANPEQWNDDLFNVINLAQSKSQETWLLALDTAYHFSPSRWVLVGHACRDLEASFMAFDLCLAPNATLLQKVILRILTALMGAPWGNFVTPDAYRQKLRDIGYEDHTIKVMDISEHVFAPLSRYMDEQDRRLKMLGLGLGSFQAAKSLFRWWGSTGVVRGVVVVAKNQKHGS